MSADLWNITAYVVSASHIRGYARGINDEKRSDQLRLSVKQYVPKANAGSITLLVAHGVGSSKESYEPLLDELLNQGILIRSAWSVDAAHHGHSYRLNESLIGDEPHWLDPCRDMLHVVNHFQHEMPAPIYAIGQSWGCTNVLMMSDVHPRLFAGMILIEPIFATGRRLGGDVPDPKKDRYSTMALLAHRRDTWSSRAEARTQLLKNPYFASFDPRVFERFMKHDLHDKPLPENPKAVTLTTPKAQEVYTFGRPAPPFPGYEVAPGYDSRTKESILVHGFYRVGMSRLKQAMQDVQPPILYVWGTKSVLGGSDFPHRIMERTGVGADGNGGVAKGRVKSTWIDGADHIIPLSVPGQAAKAIAEWLLLEIKKWNEESQRRREEQPGFDPGILNPLWTDRMPKL